MAERDQWWAVQTEWKHKKAFAYHAGISYTAFKRYFRGGVMPNEETATRLYKVTGIDCLKKPASALERSEKDSEAPIPAVSHSRLTPESVAASSTPVGAQAKPTGDSVVITSVAPHNPFQLEHRDTPSADTQPPATTGLAQPNSISQQPESEADPGTLPPTARQSQSAGNHSAPTLENFEDGMNSGQDWFGFLESSKR